MADEDAKDGLAGGAPRRRRVPPPTIDLSATEVSPPTQPTQAAAADPEPAKSSTTGSAGPEAASATPDAAPDGTPQAEPAAAGPEPAAEPAEPRRRPAPGWGHVAAGALGAVLALIVAGGLWALIGPGSGPSGDRQADLDARLARIESQLGTLSRSAPAPSTGGAKSLDDLTQRLGRIESTLTEQLAAVDRQIKPLSDRMADLSRRDAETVAAARLARERADAAAKSLADVAQQLSQLNAARANAPAVERSDLDALASRLASLEASTRQIGDQVARIAGAANPGNTRRAVVALALDSVVERGAPYRRELAALDPASVGQPAADALKLFADTGVPSAAMLARDLAAVLPQAQKAAEVPAAGGGGGFFERLQTNAERLVRVRPVAGQAQPGDEPAAVLSRVEAKTARGDIAGALANAAKLPANVRAPLEPWIKRAEAREAALAAAAALAAQSLDVIRRPAQGASDK